MLADRVHVKKRPFVTTDTTSRVVKTKTITTPLGSPHGSVSSGDHKVSKRRKLVLNTPDSDYCPEPGEKTSTKNPPLIDKAQSQKIVSTVSISVDYLRENVNNVHHKLL